MLELTIRLTASHQMLCLTKQETFHIDIEHDWL